MDDSKGNLGNALRYLLTHVAGLTGTSAGEHIAAVNDHYGEPETPPEPGTAPAPAAADEKDAEIAELRRQLDEARNAATSRDEPPAPAGG